MNKSNSQLSPELAQKLYLSLLRCRKFEEKIVELYPQQEIRCPTHLSLGQEGVAAGVCSALEKEDLIECIENFKNTKRNFGK